MIILVLAESELELIPSKIWGHPAVVSSAKKRDKKPSEILLDSNFHHSALGHIEDGYRRGRPDIVHTFLLVTLESVANKKGLVKTIVHTRNDKVIYVDKKTRMVRSYNRFVGLIEQLFREKYIPSKENPLLVIDDMSLRGLIESENPSAVIILRNGGRTVDMYSYLRKISCREKIMFIVGGFPKGGFKTDVDTIADDVISIYKDPLTSWSVASEILSMYNLVCG